MTKVGMSLKLETLESRLLLSAAGDANSDGFFDAQDLMQVLRTGNYETGSFADWSMGDWNGDATFDSDDLMLAFRCGRYGGDPVAPDIKFNGDVGDMIISGTAGMDDVEIAFQGPGFVLASLVSGDGLRQTRVVPKNAIDELIFLGDSGDDNFYNKTDVRTRVYGDSGDDKLRGGIGDDILEGGADNDILEGGGGRDIYKFRGKHLGTDTIVDDDVSQSDTLDFSELEVELRKLDLSIVDEQAVAPGNLSLILHSHNSIEDVIGSPYDDFIAGNSRDNTLVGGAGNDLLIGREGNDTLDGGSANDALIGGSEDDILLGRIGNDTLEGQDGNDLLRGEAGEDYLHGGLGTDALFGGADDDELRGGLGEDELDGGGGIDALYQEDDSLPGLGLIGSPFARRVDILSDGDPWSRLELATLNTALTFLVEITGSQRILVDSILPGLPIRIIKQDEIDGDPNTSGLNREPVDRPQGTYCDGLVVLGTCAGTVVVFGRTDSPRTILIRDWDETDPDETRSRIMTLVHEFAHNWDEVRELQTAGIDASIVMDFRAISGWTSTDPMDLGYVKATDAEEDWWHLANVRFARAYGRTNPKEDMATMWAQYYQTFTDFGPFGIAGGIAGPPFSGKFVPIDRLFEALGAISVS